MTPGKIKYAIYTWGFYPALFLLRELQDNEEFEKCKILKSALDEIAFGREWYLSTRVDDESMNKVYNAIIGELKDPKLIDSNMPHYIEEFKKHVLN